MESHNEDEVVEIAEEYLSDAEGGEPIIMKPEFINIDGFDLAIPDSEFFSSDSFWLHNCSNDCSQPLGKWIKLENKMSSIVISLIGSVGETYWRDKADEFFEKWRMSNSAVESSEGFDEFVEKYKELKSYYELWRLWRRSK